MGSESETSRGIIARPDWVPGTTIVLLLIGLPIVLATAFVQEGGPHRSGSYPSVPGSEGRLLRERPR